MTEICVQGCVYRRNISEHKGRKRLSQISYPINTSEFRILKEGYLLKAPPLTMKKNEVKMNFLQKWKLRYFKFYQSLEYQNEYFLDYFRRHHENNFPKGTIDLFHCSEISINVLVNDYNTIALKTRFVNSDDLIDSRIYYITTADQSQIKTLESWGDILIEKLQMKENNYNDYIR